MEEDVASGSANYSNELLIATAGAVLGAFIVALLGFGWRITQKSRTISREKWEEESSVWRETGMMLRLEITNVHLFQILRDFILGMILITTGMVLPRVFMNFVPSIAGLVFVFSSLIRIIRHARLMREYPPAFFTEKARIAGVAEGDAHPTARANEIRPAPGESA
jgi:hypothetical protein